MPKRKGMDIDQEYELVAPSKLKEHPQNPRRGREDVIDQSIEELGWYGAVTAQRSTGYILAGNHSHRVAKRRGAKRIPVIWKDVDDEAALKILLVDNKSADMGTYDEATLESVLAGLETLDGTGFGLPEVAEAEEADPEPVEPEDVPDDVYEPSYGVMVVCEDESHQEQVYRELSEKGWTLRVVAV